MVQMRRKCTKSCVCFQSPMSEEYSHIRCYLSVIDIEYEQVCGIGVLSQEEV